MKDKFPLKSSGAAVVRIQPRPVYDSEVMAYKLADDLLPCLGCGKKTRLRSPSISDQHWFKTKRGVIIIDIPNNAPLCNDACKHRSINKALRTRRAARKQK